MGNEFPIAPRVVPLISAQTLTASYASAGSFNFLETGYGNFLGLLIKYTKGSETGVQLKVETTSDVSLGVSTTVLGATNWFQRVAEATTGGQTTLTPAYYEMTATGNYAETITPIKGDGVKISVQADTIGGSPGTVTVYGITGWV